MFCNFILALFTVCFYHFLFWRYLNSTMTRFSSDILLPFPNSNDLNSCVCCTAVFAGNDTILTENITWDRKRFITQSKHMIFRKNKFWKLMICFCYFCQNFFSALGMAHNDPFSVQIGSKETILKRFYQLFFRTAGLQHKLWILIVSPNIFHWKSAKKSKVGLVFGTKFRQK